MEINFRIFKIKFYYLQLTIKTDLAQNLNIKTIVKFSIRFDIFQYIFIFYIFIFPIKV